MQTLYFRQIQPDDLNKVVDCYSSLDKGEQSSLLCSHDWFEQKARANEGVCAYIEDRVVAFAAWDCFRHRPLIETRTCFVAHHARGHGLQKALHALRSHFANNDTGNLVDAVSAVRPTNTYSISNLTAIGFEHWQNPDIELAELCYSCPKSGDARNSGPFPKSCCCHYYRCDGKKYYLYGQKLLETLSFRDGRYELAPDDI